MPLSAEQLELRRHGIGASEVAAVAGLLPWKSPLQVYMEKTGIAAPVEETPRMRAGNKLERVILDWAAEELNEGVLPSGDRTLVHPAHPWLFATPDGRLGSATGPVVQAKNVGEHAAKVAAWGATGTEDVPDWVRLQVEAEMEVTGVDRAFVAALIGGYDFRLYPLHRDPALAADAVEICRRFWFEHVVAGVPPVLDGSPAGDAYLKWRWPSGGSEILPATPEQEALAAEYGTARAAASDAAARRDLWEQRLKDAIGGAAGLRGAFGTATWKLDARGLVAWKAVAENLQAPTDLIEQHRGAPARRFLYHPAPKEE